MDDSLQDHLDNEWYVVRHSGEIPEIALHSALYYLTEADEGPKLHLSPHHIHFLQKAAADRFYEIILRDLAPENKDLPIYRGLQRTIFNYHRFVNFCARQQLDCGNFVHEVAGALLIFLAIESVGVSKNRKTPSINCTFKDLNTLARQLGLVEDSLPDGYSVLCLPDTQL